MGPCWKIHGIAGIIVATGSFNDEDRSMAINDRVIKMTFSLLFFFFRPIVG